MTLDLATDTLKKLKKNKQFKKAEDAFIHSDQGVHYTSPIFKNSKKTGTTPIDVKKRKLLG